MIFDPPSSSTVIDAYNRNIQEMEWRLMHTVEITMKEGG